MDGVMGGRWEVKYQWCPDGLFHGLSLEQHRSVMNSNLRGNMRDVCVSIGVHRLCVSDTLIFLKHFGRKIYVFLVDFLRKFPVVECRKAKI